MSSSPPVTVLTRLEPPSVIIGASLSYADTSGENTGNEYANGHIRILERRTMKKSAADGATVCALSMRTHL